MARNAAQAPYWPRALREQLAAAYCGVSATTFSRHIAPGVKSVPITPGIRVWLRDDLDAWLDARAGRMPGSEEPNPWH